jgi:hypothetical protein
MYMYIRHVGDVHEMVVSLSELLQQCVAKAHVVRSSVVERFGQADADARGGVPVLRLERSQSNNKKGGESGDGGGGIEQPRGEV